MPGALRRLILTAAVCLISASVFASERRRAVPSAGQHFCDFGTDVEGLTLPADFCIRKFANVPTPRALVFAPNGDLFVSSPQRNTVGGAPPGAGAIFLFRETDPTKLPTRYAFAQGSAFFSVHGIAIAQNSFYYTVDEAVYSVPYTVGATQIDTAAPRSVASFITTAGPNLSRFAHSLAVGSDGSLYVSRGQFDNTQCPSKDPRIGAVLRIGAGRYPLGDIVTSGLRDPLYIRCLPWGSCYAAELTGDTWESIGGSEKLIELHDGESFGYPCCVAPGIPNPELTPAPDCSTVAAPVRTFPIHHTPFGFDWERGLWPEPYRNAFFVGLHGAFGSWLHAGLQWAPTDPQTHFPTQPTADFALGFGRQGPIPRVADVLFASDGRLFFTDDQGGAIYWIAPRSLLLPKH